MDEAPKSPVEVVTLTDGEKRLLVRCENETNRLKAGLADLVREYENRKNRYLAEIEKSERALAGRVESLAKAHDVSDGRVVPDFWLTGR